MKLGIIIGSTRQDRGTDRAAKWALEAVKKLDNVEAELLDLKDYDLPFFDEAISPQYNPERTTTGVVKEWLAKLAEKDALIVVTPEYSRSIPAVLKNALDYVAYELQHKPVGIIAHGSTGGAQAAHTLRSVTAGVLGVSVPKAVYITPPASAAFDEDGTLVPELANNPYGPNAALQSMLGDLVVYGEAMKTVRG